MRKMDTRLQKHGRDSLGGDLTISEQCNSCDFCLNSKYSLWKKRDSDDSESTFPKPDSRSDRKTRNIQLAEMQKSPPKALASSDTSSAIDVRCRAWNSSGQSVPFDLLLSPR